MGHVHQRVRRRCQRHREHGQVAGRLKRVQGQRLGQRPSGAAPDRLRGLSRPPPPDLLLHGRNRDQPHECLRRLKRQDACRSFASSRTWALRSSRPCPTAARAGVRRRNVQARARAFIASPYFRVTDRKQSRTLKDSAANPRRADVIGGDLVRASLGRRGPAVNSPGSPIPTSCRPGRRGPGWPSGGRARIQLEYRYISATPTRTGCAPRLLRSRRGPRAQLKAHVRRRQDARSGRGDRSDADLDASACWRRSTLLPVRRRRVGRRGRDLFHAPAAGARIRIEIEPEPDARLAIGPLTSRCGAGPTSRAPSGTRRTPDPGCRR